MVRCIVTPTRKSHLAISRLIIQTGQGLEVLGAFVPFSGIFFGDEALNVAATPHKCGQPQPRGHHQRVRRPARPAVAAFSATPTYINPTRVNATTLAVTLRRIGVMSHSALESVAPPWPILL